MAGPTFFSFFVMDAGETKKKKLSPRKEKDLCPFVHFFFFNAQKVTKGVVRRRNSESCCPATCSKVAQLKLFFWHIPIRHIRSPRPVSLVAPPAVSVSKERGERFTRDLSVSSGEAPDGWPLFLFHEDDDVGHDEMLLDLPPSLLLWSTCSKKVRTFSALQRDLFFLLPMERSMGRGTRAPAVYGYTMIINRSIHDYNVDFSNASSPSYSHHDRLKKEEKKRNFSFSP